MKRSLIWRPGDWLLAVHRDRNGFRWFPSFARYAPNWWSIWWLWFEVSHASEEKAHD